MLINFEPKGWTGKGVQILDGLWDFESISNH